MEQAADKLVTYEDNKVYQTARNMMLHCIEKASHLQEKFTESKDYLINTPFMNWVVGISNYSLINIMLRILRYFHDKKL